MDPVTSSMICTDHARVFYEHHNATIGLVASFAEFAQVIDETRRIASEALADPKDHAQAEMHHAATQQDPGAEALARFRPILRETVLTRSVDNFLCYVTDLLAAIFRLRPETLRSGESVKLDFVLSHSDMDDLIDHLAERRISELTYKGVKQLNSHLDRRLGLPVVEESSDLDRLATVVDMRNLLVHSRGTITRSFKQRRPDFPGEVGGHVDTNTVNPMDHAEFLLDVVLNLDGRAQRKFDLPAHPLVPD